MAEEAVVVVVAVEVVGVAVGVEAADADAVDADEEEGEEEVWNNKMLAFCSFFFALFRETISPFAC